MIRKTFLSYFYTFLCFFPIFVVSEEKYRPQSLVELLEKVESCALQEKHPVVIFDLDETLINSLSRAWRILKDMAAQKEIIERYPMESQKISQLQIQYIRAYPLYLQEILKDAGVENSTLLQEIEQHYVDKYLSNGYCPDDLITPGASEYVNLIQHKGGWVVYLTGRNRPGMEKGTIEFLRRHRFPLGEEQHAVLVMKPSREMKDTAFKKEALATIANLGVVVGGFENEPANLNVIQDAFPEALVIFVDTVHSNRPDVPRPGIPWIKDFTLPVLYDTKSEKLRLVANQEYQNAITELLARAQISIDVVQFEFFAEAGVVGSLAETLLAKKQEHPACQIRVFLEGDKEGVAARNIKTRDKLEKAGILVGLDSENRVTHTKAALVDEKILLLGSHNWSNNSLLNNNEVSVWLESAILGKKFREYTDALFQDSAQIHSFSAQDHGISLLTDATYLPAVLEVIRQAQTTLDIAMYYIAYRSEKDWEVKEILDELIKAKSRGVQVRLLLEQSNNFAPHITAANKNAARYLQENGIQKIYWDRLDKISHAKYVVRDAQEAILGSTNWYDKDFTMNHQVNVRILDATFAKNLVRLWETKIAAEAK